MLDDHQLLRRYIADGSEAAFSDLVLRYVNLVYSAALRRTGGDAHLAQDATQLVFTDLARKARSLPDHVVLAGWLHRATRYAAAQLLRTERRRLAREQEAVAMNPLESETPSDWAQIRPLLDEALDELSNDDRDALILRFFEQRTLAEVGTALGSNEDAARKRVARALEKLRTDFGRRGITTTAATLSAAISVNAIQAAPIGLGATLSVAAIADTTFTAATATAAKTLAMTTLQKNLITITIAAAVGTGIYQARQASNARAQAETLRRQEARLTEAVQQLTRERDATTGQLDRLKNAGTELLKLRGQYGVLQQELANQNKALDESGNSTNGDWKLGNVKWKPEWKDHGLGSPVAALQTHWWTFANADIERIKASMVFDRGTNFIPITDIFAKRQAKQNGFYRGGWAVRLEGVNQYSPDRADVQIGWMSSGIHPEKPFDPLDPPVWQSDRTETLTLLRDDLDGAWKVAGNEHGTYLTWDDEDSEAVARMMLQMPPEQLEPVIVKVPERTLRVYEALRARNQK